MSQILSSTIPIPSFACSKFSIKSADNHVISGRTMDYFNDMVTHLIPHRREENCVSQSPIKGEEGFSWTSQHGFVSLSALGKKNTVDGLNEKGLDFAALSLHTTEYQKVPFGKSASALAIRDLGCYLLGTCSTVHEAKIAIKKVYSWHCELDEAIPFPPLHFTLHDAEGENIVVEYIKGEPQFYDNPFKVLTNDPEFPFFQQYLQYFNSLEPCISSNITINGRTIVNNRVGNGMVGLPGDSSPISRFVRLIKMIQVMSPAKSAEDGWDKAWGLLQKVTILDGEEIFPADGSSGFTRWSVVKDLSKKVLAWTTSYNQIPLSIDLNKIDFGKGVALEPIPIFPKIPKKSIDVTEWFFDRSIEIIYPLKFSLAYKQEKSDPIL